MPHCDPDRLALLALGEPSGGDESAHLAACPDCAAELRDLQHTARVGRASIEGILETPDPRVWARISEDLGMTMVAIAPAHRADRAGTLLTLDAPETITGVDPAILKRTRTRTPTPTRFRPWMWVLAASTALVLVLAVGAAVTGALTPTETQMASATLAALPDHPGAVGTVQIDESADGARVLDLTLESPSKTKGYREVWLMTADATGLISLGVLDGDRGTFTVPRDVDLDQYRLVDVSVEPNDGNPAHSGDSIVRGQLSFS